MNYGSYWKRVSSCKVQGLTRCIMHRRRLTIERNQPRFNATVRNLQPSNRYRQPKPSWPRTTGVDVEHAIARGYERLMRVAGDNDGDACFSRINREVAEDMQHMDGDAAKYRLCSHRQIVGPRRAVVVATHCRQRRDARERVEDARCVAIALADVAGVDDVIAACECSECLWS
jgi:hypothetical protein